MRLMVSKCNEQKPVQNGKLKRASHPISVRQTLPKKQGFSIFYCLFPELATILVPSNFWIKLSNGSRFPELISSPSHKLNTCLCFLWPWNTILPFAYWQSFHKMSWHTAVCKEPAHTRYSICRTSAPPLGNTRQISRTGKNEYLISSFEKQH